MANDFDQFPLHDPLIKSGTNKMSDIWVDFISTFWMNLIGYLTQSGIFLPVLTQSQINALLNPQNGQIVYNTTTEAPQIFQNGAWKTFTTS
jgi:hypothetical protein